MKLKKFISVCLSTGILFSSALSGGSSLFATEPGEKLIKSDSKTDLAEENGRYICLSKEDFFIEPITPDFLKRVVDIIIQLCSGKVRLEQIKDAGYIGNVLLRNASVTRESYFNEFRNDGVANPNKAAEPKGIYISFYDSLFALYWCIMRMHSEVLYKGEFQGFEALDGPERYLVALEGDFDPISGLMCNFFIVKAFVNSVPKYKSFKNIVNLLDNKHVNSFFAKYVRGSKIAWRRDFESLGVVIDREKDKFENTATGDTKLRVDNLKFWRALPSLAMKFSNAVSLEKAIINAEKIRVRGFKIHDLSLLKLEAISEVAKSKKEEYKQMKDEKEAEREKAKKKQKEYKAKQTEWQEKEKQREKVKTERKEKEAAEKAAKKAAEPQKTEEQLQQEREAAESERLKYMCAASNAEQGLVEDESGAIKTGKKVRNRKKEECLIESTSSEELTSSSMSASDRSDSPVTEFKNLNEDLQVLFETEGKGFKELKIDRVDGKYTLVYEPSLFSNLKAKRCNDAAKNDIMQLMKNLYIGGTHKVRQDLGEKRVISMSSVGQSKNDLYKTYSEKLYAVFGGKENLSLYKFKLNGSKEFRIAYFVNKEQKKIYVTDNIEHIEK